MKGPNYKGVFRRMTAENASDVLPALERGDKWLREKIANAADRYGLTRREIVDALKACAVLRHYFAKDPTRQSMHENAAAEFIQKIRGVRKFEQARSEVKFVAGGRVVDRAELRALRAADSALRHSKGVDFAWTFGGRMFYAYHKHTGAEGGAQDNQYNDLKVFVREAAESGDAGAVFIAFCDGPYYLRRNGVAEKSRVASLKEMAKSAKRGNVFVMRTEELPEFLRNLRKRVR